MAKVVDAVKLGMGITLGALLVSGINTWMRSLFLDPSAGTGFAAGTGFTAEEICPQCGSLIQDDACLNCNLLV